MSSFYDKLKRKKKIVVLINPSTSSFIKQDFLQPWWKIYILLIHRQVHECDVKRICGEKILVF